MIGQRYKASHYSVPTPVLRLPRSGNVVSLQSFERFSLLFRAELLHNKIAAPVRRAFRVDLTGNIRAETFGCIRNCRERVDLLLGAECNHHPIVGPICPALVECFCGHALCSRCAPSIGCLAMRLYRLVATELLHSEVCTPIRRALCGNSLFVKGVGCDRASDKGARYPGKSHSAFPSKLCDDLSVSVVHMRKSFLLLSVAAQYINRGLVRCCGAVRSKAHQYGFVFATYSRMRAFKTKKMTPSHGLLSQNTDQRQNWHIFGRSCVHKRNGFSARRGPKDRLNLVVLNSINLGCSNAGRTKKPDKKRKSFHHSFPRVFQPWVETSRALCVESSVVAV